MGVVYKAEHTKLNGGQPRGGGQQLNGNNPYRSRRSGTFLRHDRRPESGDAFFYRVAAGVSLGLIIGVHRGVKCRSIGPSEHGFPSSG